MKRPLSRWRWTRKQSLAAAAALMLAVLVALVGPPGCSEASDPWAGAPRPRVVVTIAPLYSFVKGVMGKQGSVKCLCTTTGPHHYQPDTRDARLLRKADVVFGVGLKLDETGSKTVETNIQEPLNKGHPFLLCPLTRITP